MKKTDRPKYLSLGICAIAYGLLIAGYQVTASFIAILPLFIAGFSPHKSGWLFVFTTIFCMSTCGFLTDFPYRQFPAASICLPLIIFIMHARFSFFGRLGVHKASPLELICISILVALFFAGAYFANYSWNQWITGGVPAMLYLFFAFVSYTDRKEAQRKLEGMKVSNGKPAPEFTLPDQNGNEVSLKGILSKNHALLIFVRGDWCPTCHIMMRGYLKNKEKFMEKNIRVVGIGPDPIGVNRDLMSRLDENSLMLADVDQETAYKFSGTLQDNNPVTKNLYRNGIPLPASFLVHMNGNIIYTSRSDRATEILQPDKIFEVLATI